jgi:hypothetical protein
VPPGLPHRASAAPAVGDWASSPLDFTNEDDEREVAQRFRQLLAARQVPPPERFYVSVRKGLWLDDPDAQQRLLQFVARTTSSSSAKTTCLAAPAA